MFGIIMNTATMRTTTITMTVLIAKGQSVGTDMSGLVLKNVIKTVQLVAGSATLFLVETVKSKEMNSVTTATKTILIAA